MVKAEAAIEATPVVICKLTIGCIQLLSNPSEVQQQQQQQQQQRHTQDCC
jgi:hypothetical protein